MISRRDWSWGKRRKYKAGRWGDDSSKLNHISWKTTTKKKKVAHSLAKTPIFFFPSTETAGEWISSLLETVQPATHVSMLMPHRQKELSSLLAIFLPFFLFLIYRRQLSRCGCYLKAAQQVCLTCLSMHQMFLLTFTMNRCLHLLGLRVRVGGRSYIIISQFTFNFSLCFRNHHATSCKQHSQKPWVVIIFYLLFFSKTKCCSQQAVMNILPFTVELWRYFMLHIKLYFFFTICRQFQYIIK